MSAFICSDRHIATIAVRYADLTENIEPQDIADRLKAINIASVNYRYDGDRFVCSRLASWMWLGSGFADEGFEPVTTNADGAPCSRHNLVEALGTALDPGAHCVLD